MAMPTEPDGPTTTEAPPYAETDKLGPLGTKRSTRGDGATSVIDDDDELRRTLVAEFQAAADAARRAAADVETNITKAVHEYRKALRRARAVLQLVAGALPRSERRAVRRALRDARRALGTARDHAVAPSSVDLVKLDAAAQHTALAILDTARVAMPELAEIKQLLNEGAARTAAQVEALEAALPATLSWKIVLRGVRSVYEDGRDARKASKRSRRAFHTWRRRTKELAYQLDILAGYTPEAVGDLQREIEAVGDTQSAAVDLLMLRDYMRTHGTGTSAKDLDAVVERIDEQVEDLIADSRRAGRDAFGRKPRRFVKKLEKAARRAALVDEATAEAALADDLD